MCLAASLGRLHVLFLHCPYVRSCSFPPPALLPLSRRHSNSIMGTRGSSSAASSQKCPMLLSVLGMALSETPTTVRQLLGSTPEATHQCREADLREARVQVSTLAVAGHVCSSSRVVICSLSPRPVGLAKHGQQTVSVLLSVLCRRSPSRILRVASPMEFLQRPLGVCM